MIFTQNEVARSRVCGDQWREVNETRRMANVTNAMHAAAQSPGISTNGGLVPRDVYQEFDRVAVDRFRSDDGDTFLNDLLPLSSSVSIGKLVQKFRQVSDAGQVQTSMSGQIGVKLDQTEFTYDGSIIPVHDTGFTRGWREWNAQTSEGFDALIDDQRESVATIRAHLADDFMDGHRDTDGNFIVVDALSWQGMRNDSRVAQADLGAGGINFDFTDTAQTGDANKDAFIEVRNIWWITNKCERDLTVYVSREVASNWERKFSANYDAKKILQELAGLMGVEEIKVSSKLTGNQLMGFPLDSNRIRPVVGMGLNTVAMPRPVYNSNYDFVVWGAIGFQVRTDFAGNTCAIYASA
jgi:hypothetical protein